MPEPVFAIIAHVLPAAAAVGLAFGIALWLKRRSVVREMPEQSATKWRPMPELECEVVFIGAEEGGRSQPIRELSSRQYRPHLVVGPRNQRHAIVVGGEFKETYYGVIFSDGPAYAAPGTEYNVQILLPFHPEEQYLPLVVGTSFTIREGFVKIVGHGKVLARSNPSAA
jgi:hypothetical protein